MKALLTTSLVIGLSVAAVAAPPSQGKSKSKSDALASLVRPEADLDGKARGSIRFRAQEKKQVAVQKLDVAGRKIDPSTTLELFMEGAAPGPFTSLGFLALDDSVFRISFDSSQGDPMPFGVESLDELVGRAVEVRDGGGDVVLRGAMPDPDAPKKPVKAALVMDAGVDIGQSPIQGKIKLRSKANKGQHRMAVKIRKAPFSQGALHLACETAVGSGVFANVGAVDQNGSSAQGRYRRDTHKGDPLPDGALSLEALAGRKLQVRDAAEDVLLEVLVPAMP
jgi:hypothetical protein